METSLARLYRKGEVKIIRISGSRRLWDREGETDSDHDQQLGDLSASWNPNGCGEDAYFQWCILLIRDM